MSCQIAYFLKAISRFDHLLTKFGNNPALVRGLYQFAGIPSGDSSSNQSSNTSNQSPKEKEKPILPNPTPEDFAKLDIRVGKVLECWKHPESEKLYCEKIDIGGEIREIGSGLQKHVSLEEMTQDLVLVLTNLKPRKLGGFPSHGMILCASNNDQTKIELLRPDPGSQVGERVTLEGYDNITQDKASVIDTKKNKVLEIVFPHFKTNGEGYASFLDLKLKTSAGYIKSKTLNDANIS